MLKALEQLYLSKKTYHSCSVLPESVTFVGGWVQKRKNKVNRKS